MTDVSLMRLKAMAERDGDACLVEDCRLALGEIVIARDETIAAARERCRAELTQAYPTTT